MQILTGLFAHMVLQRSAGDRSDAVITGLSSVSGDVVARVMRGAKPLPGFAARKIGSAGAGRFTARLKGVPTGGPYTIELSIAGPKDHDTGTLIIPDVLVGDVWIAAGQSNMEGCGLRTGAAKPHPMARAFYMDDHWGVAQDPVHLLAVSVDPVHTDLNGGFRPDENRQTGTGPSVSFAQEMYRVTGIPQGIIACAHGGTSMTQWDPARKAEGGKSLYGATIRRFQKNGGKVAGVIWYQGCSDANPNDVGLYVERMKKLVAASRRDMKSPKLPWTIVQISRVIGWTEFTHWNVIQEDQRQLPDMIPQFTTVPAIDLALDDGIHISGLEHQRLGKRMAQAMLVLTGHPKAGLPPIAVKKVSVQPVPERGMAEVVVEFANVVGRLQSGSRPTGFAVRSPDGGLNQVFDVKLEGSKAILRLSASANDVTDLVLHYGLGTDPVCNLTDGADRAVPVFGPLTLGVRRALTPFVLTPEVSRFHPSAGKLEKLRYPADPSSLGFAPRTFADRFWNLHPALAAEAPTDVVVYYRTTLECAQPMALAALMGYDGPVKLFLDGRQIYHDPKGTNPALVDAHSIPLGRVRPGKHELLVALGSNGGRAWGVFLRVQRTDVPARVLKKNPESCELPKLS